MDEIGLGDDPMIDFVVSGDTTSFPTTHCTIPQKMHNQIGTPKRSEEADSYYGKTSGDAAAAPISKLRRTLTDAPVFATTPRKFRPSSLANNTTPTNKHTNECCHFII